MKVRSSHRSTLLTLAIILTACTQSPPGTRGENDDGGLNEGGLGDDDIGEDSGGDATGESGEGEGGSGQDGSTGESDGTDDSDDGNTSTDDGSTGSGDDATDTGDGSTGSDDGTSDGGTGDGGTGDGGTDTEPEPCQVTNTTVEPLPPNVMLVLDKSGSMSKESWDHDADGNTPDITRWESLHGAVTLMVNTYEPEVKFGAKLFPEIDACGTSESCGCSVDAGVEAACSINNASGVLGAIPAVDDTVEGGTPTASGLDNAATYLEGLSGTGTEPKAMVLIADGEISCSEDHNDAVTTVTDAEAAGIPTYVIGIDAQDDPMDDSDAHDQLTDLANAGGKPNPNGPPAFYQTTNQIDLETAMNDIISDALSCEVAIDPEPQDPTLFQVWIEDTQIPLITDCATENGWIWTQNYTQVEFCGTACDDLKTAGEMEGRYFCRPG